MVMIAEDTDDYRFISALVYERSRIRLHEGKHALIRSRLGKRIRHHGFSSLHEYCEYLRREADEDEFTQVVDALATNFTSFLREPDHFEFLVSTALPALGARQGRPIQVWSAACATGEEAYSIAFHLAERRPLAEGWDWRILATDVSTKALGTAEAGIYPADRVSALPAEWLRRYFQRGHGEWEGHFRVKPLIRERVHFDLWNLLSPSAMDRVFEVIFCRNVMIYFDRATQRELVDRLVGALRPRGYLLTGRAESLHGLQGGLRCLRPSVYQRC